MSDEDSFTPRYDYPPPLESPTRASAKRASNRSSPGPRFNSKPSIIDELLPTPASRPKTARTSGETARILRRTGAVGVVVVFLLTVIFLAGTNGVSQGGADGLRSLFGEGNDAQVENAGWIAQDLDEPTSPVDDSSSTSGLETELGEKSSNHNQAILNWRRLRELHNAYNT